MGGEEYYEVNSLLPTALITFSVIGVIIWTLSESTGAIPIAPCMGSETREKVRELMLAGIDKGLESHTVHLFDIWVKDKDDPPKRAINGMQLAISAYIRSREAALKWNPPLCTGPNP